MTLRERIKSVVDHRWEAVPTPEWPDVDGQVYVRTMSAFTRAETHRRVSELGDDAPAYKAYIEFVISGACDEHGQRLFDDTDSAWLAERHPDVLMRIYEAVLKINRIGQKATEEAKGNS